MKVNIEVPDNRELSHAVGHLLDLVTTLRSRYCEVQVPDHLKPGLIDAIEEVTKFCIKAQVLRDSKEIIKFVGDSKS